MNQKSWPFIEAQRILKKIQNNHTQKKHKKNTKTKK